MTEPTLSRRTLARGAAWAAPTALVAAAAPMAAASPAITWAHVTSFRYASNSSPFCAGQDTWSLSNDPTWTYGGAGAGTSFTNTKTTTTLVNLVANYWYPRADAAFVSVAGGNACWSLPVRNAGLDTTRPGGIAMYGYTTTYTCPIVAVNGTTTLPTGFRFRSRCYTDFTAADQWTRRLVSVAINGVTESKDTSWIQITTP